MISAETFNGEATNTLMEEPKGRRFGQSQAPSAINMSQPERMASAVAGGSLAVLGLARGGWSGWLLALTGGCLVYQGATGHCSVYQALGIDTAHDEQGYASVRHNRGIKIE